MSTIHDFAHLRFDRSRWYRSRPQVVATAATLTVGAIALASLSMPTPASAAALTATAADESGDTVAADDANEAATPAGGEESAVVTPVQWPLETRDDNITDGFGNRIAPCSQCSSNHRGLDFGAPTGTPVGAIADGVVTAVQYVDDGGLGLHVVIEHEIDGQIVETVSAHLDHASITVEIGDAVKVGDRIGSVGNTGASTGPHLHLETIVDGMHRDPLAVLQKYADGDDEVEITDRPSLPWLPAGPATDETPETSSGDDAATATPAPANTDNDAVAVVIAAVDRGDAQVGVAVAATPEVLESAEVTTSIAVASDTADGADTESTVGASDSGVGVGIGVSEPEGSGSSIGFGSSS